VRIGKVLKVKTPSSPGEPITITLGVKKGTVLYKGIKASIAQVGFVGDLYILLAMDKTTSERFAPGDTIPAEEQVPFSILMARLDSISLTADSLLKDIGSLFNDKNKRELGDILKNTNSAISSGSTNIDNVLLSLNRTAEELRDVLQEVKNKPWSVVYKEEKRREE